MADPFATALDALHRGAGSVAADYVYGNGAGTWPIRVVRHQPSGVLGIGSGHAVVDGSSFGIRRSDIAQPTKGDMLELDGETLTILADGMLDAEGVSWTVQAA